MENEVIKKALTFIRKNAVDIPQTTNDNERIINEEIINEITNQIDKHNGSFAIDKSKFNELFGWKPTHSKSVYLKNKLNKQYPLNEGTEWHVGNIQKGTMYKFTTQPIKQKEEQTNEED